jgi:hypothetical protein
VLWGVPGGHPPHFIYLSKTLFTLNEIKMFLQEISVEISFRCFLPRFGKNVRTSRDQIPINSHSHHQPFMVQKPLSPPFYHLDSTVFLFFLSFISFIYRPQLRPFHRTVKNCFPHGKLVAPVEKAGGKEQTVVPTLAPGLLWRCMSYAKQNMQAQVEEIKNTIYLFCL